MQEGAAQGRAAAAAPRAGRPQSGEGFPVLKGYSVHEGYPMYEGYSQPARRVDPRVVYSTFGMV